MGRTLRAFRPVGMSILAMLSCCSCHEDRTVEFTTILPCDCQQLLDNGYISGLGGILDPYEMSSDHFYFVESPEMLDSVFMYINYPPDYAGPPLDSLFPDGGSLLVLGVYTDVEDEVLGYSIDLFGDTVKVLVEIREWDVESPEPGLREFVFPIGVVLQQPD